MVVREKRFFCKKKEDGCFAVVYGASGGAAEERGTLPAHDVFRYAVELPPRSFAQQSSNRDAWWEAVRQRVPDTAVFVRSHTVDALRKAWDRIKTEVVFICCLCVSLLVFVFVIYLFVTL